MCADIQSAWPSGLEPKQRAFLEAFSQVGTVGKASKDICHRASHFFWMNESEVYRGAFKLAERMFADHIAGVIVSRALVGQDEPVFYKGRPVRDEQGRQVTRRRPDRVLLEHLMRRCSIRADRFMALLEAAVPGSHSTKLDTFDTENSSPEPARLRPTRNQIRQLLADLHQCIQGSSGSHSTQLDTFDTEISSSVPAVSRRPAKSQIRQHLAEMCQTNKPKAPKPGFWSTMLANPVPQPA